MFEHILVPLDRSPLAENVLPHTVALAQVFESRVTLVHVLKSRENSEQIDPVEWHIDKAEAKAYLDELASQLGEVGVNVETRLLEGKPADRIIEFVRSEGINLMLLSSHGQSGLSGWNISSVVQKVIMRARISSLIVRAYQPGPGELGKLRYRHLLVPLDCSQRAEYVLPAVVKLASQHDAEVLLAHIVKRPEGSCQEPRTQEDRELVDRWLERNREQAQSYLGEIAERYDVNFKIHLTVRESAMLALHELEEEEEIDLLVMSAHGYTGSTRWPYGSLAVSFIAYGSAPLLIVQDLTPEKVKPTPAEIAAQQEKGH